MLAQRKVKFGGKISVVSSVMRHIAEELIDLTERMEQDSFDASAEILNQHYQGLVERVQIRAEILYKLSKQL